MALDLSVNRPKLAQTVPFEFDLTVGTVTEDDGNATIFVPITCQSVDPPSYSVTATTTNGSATLTSSNAFTYLKAGDALSGTGITGGTTVLSKESNSSLTMSAAATADGTVSVTVDPPSVASPTVMGLRVVFNTSGSVVTPQVSLMLYDGSLLGTAGTPANATSTISLSPSSSASFDFDAFLLKLGYIRTNS